LFKPANLDRLLELYSSVLLDTLYLSPAFQQQQH